MISATNQEPFPGPEQARKEEGGLGRNPEQNQNLNLEPDERERLSREDNKGYGDDYYPEEFYEFLSELETLFL